MVVASQEGCVNGDRVGDGFAEAVSGERHGDDESVVRFMEDLLVSRREETC